MNYYPFLFPWLVENFKTQPEKAAKLQRFLTVAEGIIQRQPVPLCDIIDHFVCPQASRNKTTRPLRRPSSNTNGGPT